MADRRGKTILKIIGTHIMFIAAAAAVVLAVNKLFGGGCLFRQLTGICCPFCGMTRAHIAAMKLDFAAAAEYHPLFFLGLPYLFLLFHERELTQFKKIRKALIIAATAAFLICWAVRLYFGDF